MLTRLAVLALLCVPALTARAQVPDYVGPAVHALEQMLASEGDEALERFLDEAMAPNPERNREATISALGRMREELRAFGGDVAIEPAPDGFRMTLIGPQGQQSLDVGVAPEGITRIALEEPESAVKLDVSRDRLAELFDELEQEGVAGVVHVRLGGEVVLERGFGMSNEALGISNDLETIFGTGSRPIDYTIAAIMLLAQRGQLDLDDPIAKHVPGVPTDKQAMTIRHCMTGASGLPDFFDNESDWDADLGWVDRETAERRMLDQDLLFEPGTGDSHSHGAFGLLAAIVERVSGDTYYDFIRENFLDPAGMTRTGEYGESRGLGLTDFAAGSGPSRIGLPNIPPNWGPTSWLVKGSGGMYSTLGDLQRFYALVRSGEVLDEKHGATFRSPTANMDGSQRGFELFSVYDGEDNEVYLFANSVGDRQRFRALCRGLERLVFDR
jgi:CubicO group peptidase (beta-lactamase class C family)